MNSQSLAIVAILMLKVRSSTTITCNNTRPPDALQIIRDPGLLRTAPTLRQWDNLSDITTCSPQYDSQYRLLITGQGQYPTSLYLISVGTWTCNCTVAEAPDFGFCFSGPREREAWFSTVWGFGSGLWGLGLGFNLAWDIGLGQSVYQEGFGVRFRAQDV